MRVAAALAALATALVVWASPAHGCSCLPKSAQQVLDDAEVAVIGSVAPEPGRSPEDPAWTVAVDEVVKGEAEPTIRVEPAQSCGGGLPVAGEQEFLRLHRREPGVYIAASPCGHAELTVPQVRALRGSFPDTGRAGPPAMVVAGEFGNADLALLDVVGRPRAFVEVGLSDLEVSACPGGRVVVAVGDPPDDTSTGAAGMVRVDVQQGWLLDAVPLAVPRPARLACAAEDGTRVAVSSWDDGAAVQVLEGGVVSSTRNFDGAVEALTWDPTRQAALAVVAWERGGAVEATPGGRVRPLPSGVVAGSVAPTFDRVAVALASSARAAAPQPGMEEAAVEVRIAPLSAEGRDVVVPIRSLADVGLQWIDRDRLVVSGSDGSSTIVLEVDAERGRVVGTMASVPATGSDSVVAINDEVVAVSTSGSGDGLFSRSAGLVASRGSGSERRLLDGFPVDTVLAIPPAVAASAPVGATNAPKDGLGQFVGSLLVGLACLVGFPVLVVASVFYGRRQERKDAPAPAEEHRPTRYRPQVRTGRRRGDDLPAVQLLDPADDDVGDR